MADLIAVPTEPTEAMDRRRDGCRSEAERSAYAEGLSDAAQRARYLAKHQEWEDDDGGPNSRRDGFEMACEVLNELLEEASSVAALKPLAAAPVPSPHGNAWRPISEHTAFGLNNSVIVAAPYDNRGERTYIVGEAYKIEPKGDAEPEWWWANTGPGDYTGDPIGSMGYGAPTLFQPLPVAPSEGVEP